MFGALIPLLPCRNDSAGRLKPYRRCRAGPSAALPSHHVRARRLPLAATSEAGQGGVPSAARRAVFSTRRPGHPEGLLRRSRWQLPSRLLDGPDEPGPYMLERSAASHRRTPSPCCVRFRARVSLTLDDVGGDRLVRVRSRAWPTTDGKRCPATARSAAVRARRCLGDWQRFRPGESHRCAQAVRLRSGRAWDNPSNEDTSQAEQRALETASQRADSHWPVAWVNRPLGRRR